MSRNFVRELHWISLEEYMDQCREYQAEMIRVKGPTKNDPNDDLIGKLGECIMHKLFGVEIDFTVTKGRNDGGVDYVRDGKRMDVKTRDFNRIPDWILTGPGPELIINLDYDKHGAPDGFAMVVVDHVNERGAYLGKISHDRWLRERVRKTMGKRGARYLLPWTALVQT